MAHDPGHDGDPPDDTERTPDDTERTSDPTPSELSDGTVLDPDELDFTKHNEVSDLGEDRFVVSADDSGQPSTTPDRSPATRNAGGADTPNADRGGFASGAPDVDGRDRQEGFEWTAGERTRSDADGVDAEAVGQWLTESMRNNGFGYGFDATLKIDGSIDRHRTTSTDAVSTFETLLLWYAKGIDDGRSVEETLGALLAASDVPITYPTQTLGSMLREHGMSRENTIDDLIGSVERAGGVRFSTR